MDFLVKALVFFHVSAGFTALCLFFVPAVARKGGRVHNLTGRWYTYAMWTVVGTAGALCVYRYATGHVMTAMFLGFLALLTARPLYYGVAVLRNKREPSRRMLLVDRALRSGLAGGGPYLIGAGLGWWGPGAHTLFIVFGTLGTLVSVPGLLREWRGTPVGYNWLEQHLSHMIVTAIAAFTAFFAFGGRSLFGDAMDGPLQTVVWITPTLLGVAFSRWYKYRLRARTQVPG